MDKFVVKEKKNNPKLARERNCVPGELHTDTFHRLAVANGMIFPAEFCVFA